MAARFPFVVRWRPGGRTKQGRVSGVIFAAALDLVERRSSPKLTKGTTRSAGLAIPGTKRVNRFMLRLED